MLRNRIRLSVLAGRLRTPILGFIGVTLLYSLLAVLPPASGPGSRLTVELTSGGKFAARIPGAAQDPAPAAEESRAATSSGARGALQALLDVALMPLTGSDAMAAVASSDVGPGSTPDKVARKLRPARPALPRHPAEAAPLPLARPAALPVVESAADEGVLPKVMASARSLWSLSASTGASLVSRLVP